jgi:hypothetical protein
LAVVRGAIDETVATLRNEPAPPLSSVDAILAGWRNTISTSRGWRAAYLNQIQDYAKLRIDVSEEAFTDADNALASATVRQAGEDPIPIRFMMEDTDHSWSIYDVSVEDVGLVQNYRMPFDRVIADGGMNQSTYGQTQAEADPH